MVCKVKDMAIGKLIPVSATATQRTKLAYKELNLVARPPDVKHLFLFHLLVASRVSYLYRPGDLVPGSQSEPLHPRPLSLGMRRWGFPMRY